MNRHAFSFLGLALLAGVSNATTTVSPPVLASGIATQNIDTSVRPQNDFFEYMNGKWLKTAEIPTGMPLANPFVDLYLESLGQLHGIVEAAAKHTAEGKAAPGSNEQRLGDLYASYMDEAVLERLGVTPLKRELDRIAALKDKSALAGLLAHLNRIGVLVPYQIDIAPDGKDATRYVVSINQSGLGLPDPDYYLKRDDTKLAATKAKYAQFVEAELAMAGDRNAAADTRAVIEFETELARIQWTAVELRDPVKAYNKVALADMGKLAPGFDWNSWLNAVRLSGKSADVIVTQPTYLKAFAVLSDQTPLATWKAYLSAHLVSSYSNYLSKAFVDARFDFNGKTLAGVTEQSARWKYAVSEVEDDLGEALGERYVAVYFPAGRKARVEALMRNLLATFKASIDTLDWMSPATKKEAQAKLAKITTHVGYPDKWCDYAALVVKRDDLVGNVMRSREFEFDRQLNKLGRPIDRTEWNMTPQTANAYYSPGKNQIVIPAAMLRPPFFDANADDAVNYGGIGAVLAHEISHAFDDQGSQYDGDGNVRDWWTAADHALFKARTGILVAQANAVEALPGYHLNGELTLGENIADNSGLAIAYRAYHKSLMGKAAPVIDGLTGDQRLYMGFAQIWREKMTENMLIMMMKANPHPPGEFRTNATLRNQPGFYDAFDVKSGDKMYLKPADRVVIW